ncbi:cyclase family protein [Stappia indica]|uniref:Cyclase family protein n=1 Tax=Stappia indica TaxID=538381 RepID=A0A857C3G2_9HYPH|nr:cyclase family protein [Stappia indica]QGZ33550.1 cyclase family protein [Stappia indica]
MCVPGCQEVVARRLSRRGLLKGLVGTTAGAAVFAAFPPPRAAHAADVSFTRAVDLTHALGEDFPTFFGKPQLRMERTAEFSKDGFNMYQWHLDEHTGTHLDAPLHFSADGVGADEIPMDQLIVPLAVVDIREKAAADPDHQLSVDDLKAFEATHGDVPAGGCVAMNSGWAQHVASERYRNADAEGAMHFPGFSKEACLYLMEKGVVGIAVDTLSLDHGASRTFDTHYTWLPSGRWGLECLAGLDEVPATGATLVVGAPKIKGATGGPSRVFALV